MSCAICNDGTCLTPDTCKRLMIEKRTNVGPSVQLPTLTVDRYGPVTRIYWDAGVLRVERTDAPPKLTPEELQAQIAALWEPRAVIKTAGLS